MSVKDVRVKAIPVGNLGGKERSIKYDLNAFAELEEHYGSVDKAMEELEQGSIKAVRVMLWAGLIHEELDDKGIPMITPKLVGSWIGIGDLEELSTKIYAAMESVAPKVIPGADKKIDPQP